MLTSSEIVAFWQAADAERVEFGALLKVLLATGCRLNEVAGMRRAELSDDGAVWTIPGERTKNARSHVVPLSPLVRELIASVGTDGEPHLHHQRRHPAIGLVADQEADSTRR